MSVDLFIKVFLSITIVFYTGKSFSQNLTIEKIEYKNNQVLVHYDLVDSIAGRLYTVRLYSSFDNFLNPLTHLIGATGFEIKPGLNKLIIWDAKNELGSTFNGKVALELRASLFIPFIKFNNFEGYKNIVRGRRYNITWTGGTTQNILNFDLYKAEKKIASFPNIANVGYYSIRLPTNVKPGKGYRLRVSDSKNSDEVVNTGLFAVKSKIPLSVKVVSAVLLVGTTYYLLSRRNNDLPYPFTPD